MAYPSNLVRTKDWGTEILTDSDLEGQLDIIINWVDAFADETTGHKHDGTSNEGPKLVIADSTDTKLNGGAVSELTIATGAITITKTYHTVDTESDASTDDLDTISGGTAGDIIVLSAADGARDVVVKDGTGNIKSNGDFTLDNAEDTWSAIYDGTNWLELSRSDNGA